jgi:hypothetical protein
MSGVIVVNGKEFAAVTPPATTPASLCAPVFVNGKAAGPSNASLPAHEQEPEDWREQKFWWRGTLSASGTWSGAWVSSFKGKPSDAQFAASATTFEVSGPACEASSGLPVSGSYVKGHYLMDNSGDMKLTKFKDSACSLHFQADKVQGKGDTAFGVFYVQGTFNAATRDLCLERTYCDEDDATFMTMPGPVKKSRKKK